MVEKIGSPQPVLLLPPIDDIPDGDEDKAVPGAPITTAQGPLKLPSIIFGAGPLSTLYNSEDYVAGADPFRTIRLALRYGINCFDTSVFYGVSEILLGLALKALEPEFPRSSYTLVTKVGRYGQTAADFDYSAATTRACVMRALKRMNTSYLDIVYVHDVEYVCERAQPPSPGDPATALADRSAYGIAEGQEARILGPGDEKLLEAIGELRKLKAEGVIKAIGISGYPLPTLLRLSLLVLHTAPFEPLDVLLSFSQLTLQNMAFLKFADELHTRARIGQLVVASPFNMGFLTPRPASWHNPAPPLAAAREAALKLCEDRPGGLPDVALGFSYRVAAEHGWPFVAGFSTPYDVHESVRVWRELQKGGDQSGRREREEQVRKLFEDSGYFNWSWTVA